MRKKERLKQIELKYQAKLNYMGNNDLIDAYVAFGLALLLIIAIDKLKVADGRRRDYKEYERLTLENLEKAFNDVEKEKENEIR